MTEGYLVDVFDMLNVRDLDLVSQASAACTRLVVGVCSDDVAEAVLGRRPIIPDHERLALVAQVRGVDAAVLHRDRDQSPADGAVLLVPQDRPALHAPGAVVLTPGRRTRSLLLAALDGADEVDVA